MKYFSAGDRAIRALNAELQEKATNFTPKEKELAGLSGDDVGLKTILKVNPALRAELLDALLNKDFSLLDKILEEKIQSFENGSLAFYDLSWVFGSFSLSNPDLEPLFKEWETLSNSWASHAASGVYHLKTAWQWRGSSSWQKVPDLNKKAFQKHLALANNAFNLCSSNKKRDEIIAVSHLQTRGYLGLAPKKQLLEEAFSQYPDLSSVYHYAIDTLQPKWGGDQAQRQNLITIAENLSKQKTELADLKGIALYYKSIGYLEKGNYSLAKSTIREAMKLNPHSLLYRIANIRILQGSGSYEEVMFALNAYDVLSPKSIFSKELRLSYLSRVHDWSDALPYVDEALQYSTHDRDLNLLAFKVYGHHGLKEKAMASLDRVMLYIRHDPDALNELAGSAEYSLKDTELSKKLALMVLAERKFDVRATRRLSEIYSKENSCKEIDTLEMYFIGCKMGVGNADWYCKPKFKNWAYDEVNRLKQSKLCPSIEGRQFDGEITADLADKVIEPGIKL